MGGLKGQLDCIQEFSEVDYTEDLKKIDIPVLVAHGDDDQIVPIGASALMSSKILKQRDARRSTRAAATVLPRPTLTS